MDSKARQEMTENNFYVAIEANEHLDIVDRDLSIFEALCAFRTYENLVDNDEPHPIWGDLQDTDEIEIGKFVGDEMHPIDYIHYEEIDESDA